MARKKKETEELEMELDELELDEDETSEEDDEAELKEPEEITLQDESEDEAEEVEPAPKAPRRRAAKAKKAVTPKVEADAEEEIAAEKPAPKAPKKAEVRTAAAVVATAPEAKDTVVLQWEAAKHASESIVGSLDKVNSMLRELPEYYSTALQKAFKNNTPRTSPAAKVAFGMSLVATVLSVLSLSFSQSARQAALTQVAVPAIHHVAPTPAPEKKIEQAAAEAPKKKPNRRSR